MRNTTLLFLLALANLTQAQPDDWMVRFTNPCGMPPNDSLDMTGDGIPDLLIGGWSVGTDDEPSSSGSCTRFVGTLPGTTLLCGLDRTGQRVPQAFSVGDTVPAFPTGASNDLQIPRFAFAERAIIVWQWGYGHQDGTVVPTPELEKQVFVFATIASDRVVRGTFRIHAEGGPGDVRIHPGAPVLFNGHSVIR